MHRVSFGSLHILKWIKCNSTCISSTFPCLPPIPCLYCVKRGNLPIYFYVEGSKATIGTIMMNCCHIHWILVHPLGLFSNFKSKWWMVGKAQEYVPQLDTVWQTVLPACMVIADAGGCSKKGLWEKLLLDHLQIIYCGIFGLRCSQPEHTTKERKFYPIWFLCIFLAIVLQNNFSL